MLNARLGSFVHVTLAPSACVVVLVVLACADCNIGNIEVVFALGSFDVGRANVGCSSAANAEGTVSMVADLSLANDLSVAIPAEGLDGNCATIGHTREDILRGVNPNVSSSCPRVSSSLVCQG